MASTTATRKTKKILGTWDVKVQGHTIDSITANVNSLWTLKNSEDTFRYIIMSDDDNRETDYADEVRQMVADMIREIRANAIDAQRDRDNDQLDEAIEAIKDSGKARKALEVLRAAGLI